MGSGLCRKTDERPRTVQEFNGVYRKIVFNYAKQCTRYSDKHKKSGKKNTKQNKSRRKKPIISGPFPADPDRLHGDKWQYVILTRLDTEPPPERPPRTKRRHRQDNIMSSSGVYSGIVRWGSERRQSFGRRRQPKQQLSADEPTESMSSRRDVGGGGGTGESEGAAAVALNEKASPAFEVSVNKSPLWVVLWSAAVVAGRTYAARRNGLLKSVARVNAMADDLLS